MKKTISIVLALAMIFSFAACGTKKTNTNTDTPAGAVETLLTALKDGDADTLTEAFGNSDVDSSSLDLSQFKEQAGAFFKNLSWTIGDTTEEGDTATVEVDLTNTDMAKVFQDYMSAAMSAAMSGGDTSEEAMSKLLIDTIGKTEDIVKNTVTVTVNKTDGKWTPEPDETFLDAAFGGLITSLGSLAGSFAG